MSSSAPIKDSKVLGFIPSTLADKNITDYTISNELKVSPMHERMASMIYNTNTFIALSSGLGIWKVGTIEVRLK